MSATNERFQFAGALWWLPIAFAMEFVFSILGGFKGRGAIIWIFVPLFLVVLGLLVDVAAAAILRLIANGTRTKSISAFLAQAVLVAWAPLMLMSILVALVKSLDWDKNAHVLLYVGHIFFVYSFPMSMIAYYRANRRSGTQNVSQVVALGVSLAAGLLWEVTLWFEVAPWAH